MGYIQRAMRGELMAALEEYPVATVLGPRQSGKTTFVKRECAGFSYANLEDPQTRRIALEDPKGFLRNLPVPAIIDEAQRAPDLLSAIQILVDERSENGMYVLTGSHQLSLSHSVAQSLAGRTAILTLLPLSMEELGGGISSRTREEILFSGFLPRIHDQKQDPNRAYRNYFRTYVERDLRSLLNVKDLSKFETFMRLTAGRIGQVFSASSLAGDVGVSYKSIQEWLSILEASYIIFKLPPYFENIGKRLIKAPKYYFVEPGLAVYLLGIERPDQLTRDPLFGNLFENLVVSECLKARLNRGKEPALYFLRDSKGFEIDLIYDSRPSALPIEIKSASTWVPEMAKNLRFFQEKHGSDEPGILIYGGDSDYRSEAIRTLGFRRCAEALG